MTNINYTVKTLRIVDGKPLKAYVGNDGRTLEVWRKDHVRNMIKRHLAKPGTNEKTFLDSLTDWFTKQCADGDEMQMAWAEACCLVAHEVQPEFFIDLFA